jgi:hypothetical protein
MGPVHGVDERVAAEAVAVSARSTAVAATSEIDLTTIRG